MTRPQLFRSILCPVDFSTHSQQALRYAALLAFRNQARLTVTFVEDPLLAAATKRTRAPLATRAGLQRFVERATAPYGVTIGTITSYVAVGTPHREILRAASRFDCDLIVMGAHGVTGVSKMMLGSTTERVLREAPIPVLAIPPWAPLSSNALRRWPQKWTLAPIELGRSAMNDIAAAAACAERFGTLLLLLHVVPPRNRSRIVKARVRLEKLKAAADAQAMTACIVLAGKPAEQIAALAAEVDVDLVILTRRRGKGMFGARLGSVSYQVLREGGTPVLALPNRRTWLRRVTDGGTRRVG